MPGEAEGIRGRVAGQNHPVIPVETGLDQQAGDLLIPDHALGQGGDLIPLHGRGLDVDQVLGELLLSQPIQDQDAVMDIRRGEVFL